jgi:hypothetical protein
MEDRPEREEKGRRVESVEGLERNVSSIFFHLLTIAFIYLHLLTFLLKYLLFLQNFALVKLKMD